MIAFLRGALLEKHPNQVIVDVHGVGYDVTIPVSTFSSLGDAGSEVRLVIHTHVREDAIALFGFLTTNEKLIFEKLLGVSGIGPKLAVTVLSGLPIGELVGAIRGNHLTSLVKIPGVGKKTAERMVLELRDKLAAPVSGGPAAAHAPALSDVERDVLSALTNLGCARPAAEAALQKVRATRPELTAFEAMFRTALEMVRP